MSALVLGAGAFVALDRNGRAMAARLRLARGELGLRTTGATWAQVWRDPGGRQANVARVLRCTEVVPVGERLGREGGVLMGDVARRTRGTPR